MSNSKLSPKTYIAFLRAINVGGRVVKMERLRELFSELGFTGVRSYIQTGNIFFETTETDRAAITGRIERHLLKSLGYVVVTFLRTVAELERAIELNPFAKITLTPDVRFCILFLSKALPDSLEMPYSSPNKDIQLLSATPGEVFAVLYQQPGRAANPAAFLEKTFAIKTTVRFFVTTTKILQAAKQSE